MTNTEKPKMSTADLCQRLNFVRSKLANHKNHTDAKSISEAIARLKEYENRIEELENAIKYGQYL